MSLVKVLRKDRGSLNCCLQKHKVEICTQRRISSGGSICRDKKYLVEDLYAGTSLCKRIYTQRHKVSGRVRGRPTTLLIQSA
jgi:hypothetical protein